MIQVLEDFDSSKRAQGGHIILISDGAENEYPYIDDVRPDLIEKRVTVHSILYSEYAEPKMEKLSKDTGGKSFFDSGLGVSTDLLEGLISIGEEMTDTQIPGSITSFSPKVQVG